MAAPGRKKGITLARDIFERKEREEMEREMRPNIMGILAKIKIDPQMIQGLREIVEGEEKKRREKIKINERWEKFSSIFALVVAITIMIGCIWLIKIFIRGILG